MVRRPWMIVAATALLAAPARAETLEEQVNRAIERGVVDLRQFLGEDGAGKTDYHKDYPEGDTALLLYTLVKSGVSVDDPQVRKSLDWLRYRQPTKTYSAAMYVLALDALKDRQFDKQIQATAKWLEDHFLPQARRWAYPEGDSDLSNTQYGALALWAAERHGFKAKTETWGALLTGVVEEQHADGGFSYHPDWDVSGAMSVAGLTVLELALPRVPEHDAHLAEPHRRAKAALERGWTWLEHAFIADGNPHAHGFVRTWTTYYLYGVERLAAIARRDKIGAHDWYREGARHLVAVQHEDGSWGGPADTCFALLFLRRATLTSMDETGKPLEGGGVDAAAKGPARPTSAVRWIRRWLTLGPASDPADAFFDAPPFALAALAPTSGTTTLRWKWTPLASRERWLRFGSGEHPLERSTWWAFTYLAASADCDAVLWLGQDDGVKVLLDGAPIFATHCHEGEDCDAHGVPAHLTSGVHRLLLQVENWGGETKVALRVARPDGTPCSEVRPSLRPDGADAEDSARAQPGFFSLDELAKLLPRDRRLDITFASEDHLDRLALDGDGWGYPRWVAKPEDAGDYLPSPGATGLLGMHPTAGDLPATAYWRVALSARPSRLRVRATCAARAVGTADSLLRVGVFDGSLRWPLSEVVGPIKTPEAANWKWYEADLGAWAGKDVLLVVQAAAGGANGWYAEDLWIDQIEIVPAK